MFLIRCSEENYNFWVMKDRQQLMIKETVVFYYPKSVQRCFNYEMQENDF